MSNSNFFFIFFTSPILLFFIWVSLNSFVHSLCPQTNNHNSTFNQRINHFWEFDEQTKNWVQLKLPYDLLTCVNNNCKKVGSIDPIIDSETQINVNFKKRDDSGLNLRKRISLIKMSETSIWVTGESGSIYERFWNGVKWVIAPHHLPLSAGYAVSVFIVNQTILALSQAGFLYQMELSENSQPVWVEFGPPIEEDSLKETEQQESIIRLIKSGVISQDRQRIYFYSKDGLLLELEEILPPRWINHGRPPGANIAGIVDVDSIRPHLLFTVSSTGDLYEYHRSMKPSWKKHIWGEEGSSLLHELIPSSVGSTTIHEINGPHSVSLFLLTQDGNLVERRLNQRKWKWVVHGSPKDHHLTSITPTIYQDEFLDDVSHSLFFTTSSGFVFEYQIPKYSDIIGEDNEISKENRWVNHLHPPHAKVAKGIRGLQFQVGRFIFPLDDGRLGELHLPGYGGETAGPTQHHLNNINTSNRRKRRKSFQKYAWSILDAPESEGWNTQYCTEEYGSSNCVVGVKDRQYDADVARSTRSTRKSNKQQHSYLLPDSSASGSGSVDEYYNSLNNMNIFRLRVMREGGSFFFVTDSGLTFEYLIVDNMWMWLRHEHSSSLKGALGSYNGSLFLVDENMNLLVRERTSKELSWLNCTALRKGKHVVAGSPWDLVPGRYPKVTREDALFFLSKNGRLLQLTVALRKFKWKDCKNPPNTKIASIIDKEIFRENIVFVVGRNGRLYQYNKITQLWHQHYQSQHLVLSRLPGTAMRSSSESLDSLTGSLFMISEKSELVEYHWDSLEGWNWVEHGTPYIGVDLVGGPGPCFGENQLFLVGSDGKVYTRYLDYQGTWEWADYGSPYSKMEVKARGEEPINGEQACPDQDYSTKFQEINKNCDSKVASTRPISFAEDSVIFELRDGRLAEMRRTDDDGHWVWSRIIGTPTSLCMVNYWTTLAS